MPHDKASRAARYASIVGRHAEDAVAAHLLNNGYTLLGRNVRVGRLELDIVARKESLVVIVEVRHRGPTSWETAFESVNAAKRQRLFRAADRLWTHRFASDPTIDRVRIDIASVSIEPSGTVVEYLEGGIDRRDYS